MSKKRKTGSDITVKYPEFDALSERQNKTLFLFNNIDPYICTIYFILFHHTRYKIGVEKKNVTNEVVRKP